MATKLGYEPKSKPIANEETLGATKKKADRKAPAIPKVDLEILSTPHWEAQICRFRDDYLPTTFHPSFSIPTIANFEEILKALQQIAEVYRNIKVSCIWEYSALNTESLSAFRLIWNYLQSISVQEVEVISKNLSQEKDLIAEFGKYIMEPYNTIMESQPNKTLDESQNFLGIVSLLHRILNRLNESSIAFQTTLVEVNWLYYLIEELSNFLKAYSYNKNLQQQIFLAISIIKICSQYSSDLQLQLHPFQAPYLANTFDHLEQSPLIPTLMQHMCRQVTYLYAIYVKEYDSQIIHNKGKLHKHLDVLIHASKARNFNYASHLPDLNMEVLLPARGFVASLQKVVLSLSINGSYERIFTSKTFAEKKSFSHATDLEPATVASVEAQECWDLLTSPDCIESLVRLIESNQQVEINNCLVFLLTLMQSMLYIYQSSFIEDSTFRKLIEKVKKLSTLPTQVVARSVIFKWNSFEVSDSKGVNFKKAEEYAKVCFSVGLYEECTAVCKHLEQLYHGKADLSVIKCIFSHATLALYRRYEILLCPSLQKGQLVPYEKERFRDKFALLASQRMGAVINDDHKHSGLQSDESKTLDTSDYKVFDMSRSVAARSPYLIKELSTEAKSYCLLCREVVHRVSKRKVKTITKEGMDESEELIKFSSYPECYDPDLMGNARDSYDQHHISPTKAVMLEQQNSQQEINSPQEPIFQQEQGSPSTIVNQTETGLIRDPSSFSKETALKQEHKSSTQETALKQEHKSSTQETALKQEHKSSTQETALKQEHKSSTQETALKQEHKSSTQETAIEQEHKSSTQETALKQEHKSSTQETALKQEHKSSTQETAIEQEHKSSTQETAIEQEHKSSTQETALKQEHKSSTQETALKQEHKSSTQETALKQEHKSSTQETALKQEHKSSTQETAIEQEHKSSTQETAIEQEHKSSTQETALKQEHKSSTQETALKQEHKSSTQETALKQEHKSSTQETALKQEHKSSTQETALKQEHKSSTQETALKQEHKSSTQETALKQEHKSSTQETALKQEHKSSTQETALKQEHKSSTQETALKQEHKSSTQETALKQEHKSSTQETALKQEHKSSTQETALKQEHKSSTQETALKQVHKSSTQESNMKQEQKCLAVNEQDESEKEGMENNFNDEMKQMQVPQVSTIKKVGKPIRTAIVNSHVLPDCILQPISRAVHAPANNDTGSSKSRTFKASKTPTFSTIAHMAKGGQILDHTKVAYRMLCNFCDNAVLSPDEKAFCSNFFFKIYDPEDESSHTKEKKLPYGSWLYRFAIGYVFRTMALQWSSDQILGDEAIHNFFEHCRHILLPSHFPTSPSTPKPQVFLFITPILDSDVLSSLLVSAQDFLYMPLFSRVGSHYKKPKCFICSIKNLHFSVMLDQDECPPEQIAINASFLKYLIEDRENGVYIVPKNEDRLIDMPLSLQGYLARKRANIENMYLQMTTKAVVGLNKQGPLVPDPKARKAFMPSRVDKPRNVITLNISSDSSTIKHCVFLPVGYFLDLSFGDIRLPANHVILIHDTLAHDFAPQFGGTTGKITFLLVSDLSCFHSTQNSSKQSYLHFPSLYVICVCFNKDLTFAFACRVSRETYNIEKFLNPDKDEPIILRKLADQLGVVTLFANGIVAKIIRKKGYCSFDSLLIHYQLPKRVSLDMVCRDKEKCWYCLHKCQFCMKSTPTGPIYAYEGQQYRFCGKKECEKFIKRSDAKAVILPASSLPVVVRYGSSYLKPLLLVSDFGVILKQRSQVAVVMLYDAQREDDQIIITFHHRNLYLQKGFELITSFSLVECKGLPYMSDDWKLNLGEIWRSNTIQCMISYGIDTFSSQSGDTVEEFVKHFSLCEAEDSYLRIDVQIPPENLNKLADYIFYEDEDVYFPAQPSKGNCKREGLIKKPELQTSGETIQLDNGAEVNKSREIDSESSIFQNTVQLDNNSMFLRETVDSELAKPDKDSVKKDETIKEIYNQEEQSYGPKDHFLLTVKVNRVEQRSGDLQTLEMIDYVSQLDSSNTVRGTSTVEIKSSEEHDKEMKGGNIREN